MATTLNPTDFGYQNFFSAVLTSDITSSTTTIGLDTVPTPTSGILVIDPDSSTSREIILYTSKGATTITCPSDGRGYNGTTATSHLTGTTVIMAPVAKWFTAIASGELSTDVLRTVLFNDFVYTGCVWSVVSALNGSMTGGTVYINGRAVTVAAVSSHTFTASKDTYISVDNTGTITYSEVANLSTSPPALPSNSVWLGCAISGASLTGFDEISIKYASNNVLARRKLGVASDYIIIPTFAAYEQLEVVVSTVASSTSRILARINNDSGSNYAYRSSTNGAADATATSQSAIILSGAAVTDHFMILDISNVSSLEKRINTHENEGVSGAGTAPGRVETIAKWANTAAQMTRLDIFDDQAGTLGVGSEVIVRTRNR